MTLNFAFWLSLVLAINTCVGMLLAGKGKWYGWGIGLLSQPIWAWYAIVSEGYGLLLTVPLFSYVYVKNLLLWRKEKKFKETYSATVSKEFMSVNEFRASRGFKEFE